ncbi:MAG TPA: molybdopterin-dependent oxidoreductase [Thermoanaerobaculia bacterium]|nr:molybdopterin-dependent oxidoreductase [Thermoanaerobaculia bacterium]
MDKSETTTTLSTTCVMDCPDTCALEVEVRDDRIEAIRGGHDHPLTAGFICSKIARFAQRVEHPSRILHPLRRRGPKGSGDFEPVSWTDAIDEITTRFRAIRETSGAEAILPYRYGGSNGFLGDGLVDELYFRRLGASQIARTLCAAPTGAVATAMYGKMAGVAYEDYPEAKCIIVWGTNPKATSIHFIPWLHEAKRSGAFIAVVDPRLNFAAKEVDLHLPLLPGTDLPLALALIRIWNHAGRIDRAFLQSHAADDPGALLAAAEEWTVERASAVCGVKGESIELLAERFAEASPAVIRCGWGLERNRNGARSVAAVLAIPALLGKFGLRGGGYTLSNSAASRMKVARVIGDAFPPARTLNMSQLGPLLDDRTLDPPVRALFVYNCNPAVTVPDQERVIAGLMRDDLFTVVSEQVMTDTAIYADLVLPATTFLEQWEIRRGYGAFVVGGIQPVISPRGESKPNHQLFAELGRAMGFDDAPFHWSEERLFDETARALEMPNGASLDTAILRAGRSQRYDFPGETPVQFRTVLPVTPDGKICITPSILGVEPYQFMEIADPSHPLALVSPASPKMITSSMGEYNFGELTILIHPDDASSRAIASGDTVRVFNQLGEVVCRAEVSAKIRQGVVLMPKGSWMKSSGNRRGATALCPAHVEDVAGGACYNDARVEIRAVRS